MKSLTRAFSALAFVGTVLASSAAFAGPVDIANQAYRGELEGIPGYQQLEQGLNSRNITVDDVIEASGEESTPELRSELRNALRAVVDFN